MDLPTIFPSVEHIATPYNGVLLDAYGVFWGGNGTGVLPGAKAAMERLCADGKVVGILSNTTQMGEKEIVKLRAHGLFEGEHFHFMVTSGDVAKKLFAEGSLPFATPNRKYWLLGGVHPRFGSHLPLFQNSPYTETADLQQADFIYLSIPHIDGEDQTDPEVFRKAVEGLSAAGQPVVCTNPDRFAHEGAPPRAVVRQGTLAKMHEENGGQVFYIGKPSSLMYEAAMSHFSKYKIASPSDILMVGDTPETDIRGARSYGVTTALLTNTGIFADRIAAQGFDFAVERLPPEEVPHFYVEALGAP